jgi:conjugative transfer region protein TrbK
MRGKPFHFPRIARVTGYIAVAALIVCVGIHLRHEDTRKAVSLRVPATTTDQLATELARCQGISMAAKDDAACEAAWAENRRRFFTYRPAISASVPRAADPMPTSKAGEP